MKTFFSIFEGDGNRSSKFSLVDVVNNECALYTSKMKEDNFRRIVTRITRLRFGCTLIAIFNADTSPGGNGLEYGG